MSEESPSGATPRINLTREMQTHILAFVLREPGMMARLRPDLNPDYFEDTAVSDIVAWTVQFWDEHKELPSKQALMDVFRDQKDLVRSLWKQQLVDSKHTVQRIRDFAHNRAMCLAAARLVEVLGTQRQGETYVDPKTRKEVTDAEALKGMEASFLVGRGADDLGDDWDAVMERNLDHILNPVQEDVLGTGLPHLDMAGVALRRGEVGLVLGVTKRGKSHFLVNIAHHARRCGRNVLYDTLEMDNELVFRRFYGRLAGRREDVKGNPASFVESVRRKSAKEGLGRLIMKRFPARGATVDDLRAHLTQLRATFPPEMQATAIDTVVVDYAQLVRPRTSQDKDYLELLQVFLDLRALAAEFNVRLWTAAQFKVQSVNKDRPGLDDVGGATQIIAHVDVAFGIGMSDEEKDRGEGRAIVLAARNNADGQIVRFKHDYSRSFIETVGFEDPPAAKKARSTRGAGEDRAQAAYHKGRAAIDRERTQREGEQP